MDQVLRDTRGRVAPDRLYNWLGMFSDSGFQLLDRDIVSFRSRLEWDAEALKALIAHAVDTCLASGEDCAHVVDRRLFGARPFRYGHWCMEKALAAGDPEAASFYLRELFDCVTDGRRASGLTVERARAGLAADEALLRQFDRMSEHPTGPESRPEDGTKAESPEEPAERPRGQAQVLKRFPPAETDAALQALCWSLHAALAGRDWTEVGRVVEERLDRGGQSPGERRCWLMAGYLMDPER